MSSEELHIAALHQSGLYKPLESDFIRVLHLQPAQSLEASLVGTLEISRAKPEATYEALSYAWEEFGMNGLPLLAGQIELNGVSAIVTGNLCNALRRLRRNTQERTLWVDAICINQNDLSERSVQVAMMAQIYSNATQVIMWVGEESAKHDGKMMFDRAKWRSRVWDPEHPSAIWRRVYGATFGAKYLYPLYHCWMYKTLSLHPSRKRERVIACFYSRRYFHRRWVVQEIALAQKVVLACGPYSIPFSELDTGDWMGMKRIDARYTEHGLFGTGVDFKLMVSCAYLECSDERDCIYALGSILELKGDQPSIPIDYTLDWRTVHVRFTRDILMAKGIAVAWWVLCWAASQCGRKRPSGLPSWVPQWHLSPCIEDTRSHVIHNVSKSLVEDTTRANATPVLCNETVVRLNLAYHGTFQWLRTVRPLKMANGFTNSKTPGNVYLETYQPDDALYGLRVPDFERADYTWHILVLRRCVEQESVFRLAGLIYVEWALPGLYDLSFESMHDVDIV